MNNLSDGALRDDDGHCCSSSSSSCDPIPAQALYVLVPLFLLGLAVSLFILAVVHNAFFFVSLLLLSGLVLAFLLWNVLFWRRDGSLLLFFHSFPDSDLRLARHGQLVKITGLVSCGSVSLESSYEKAARCIYTSTLLYEYRGFSLKPSNVMKSCFQWSVTYSERFSTDFYITDRKSGIQAMVKAGCGSKVIPLIFENRLVNTTRKCSLLSSHLRKWLNDRNLPSHSRPLRLQEGYIEEGNSTTVFGMLLKTNDILMIVEPPEVVSTGCLWRKLLLSVDIDGLILGVPKSAGPAEDPNYVQQRPE